MNTNQRVDILGLSLASGRANPPYAEPGRNLVSVVICVYNAGEFLRPAVLSVLNQTYADLEVIIVDDGSDDGCMSSITDLSDSRIRILSQKNGGKPSALNYALAELRGEFYAIQDADDLCHPTRIERQLGCLRDNPDLAAVFCGHELILDGRCVAPRRAPKNRAECLEDIANTHMPAHDPTAMYRVSMVSKLRYDEELHIAEGYDYISRVGERFPMMVLGECLYSYRIHRNTLTTRDPVKRQLLLRRAAEKLIERRKLSGFRGSLPQIAEEGAVIRNRDLDNDVVSHFMLSTLDTKAAGEWGSAVHDAAVCITLHPSDPHYYKPMLYALAPLSLIRWYRNRKAKANLAAV